MKRKIIVFLVFIIVAFYTGSLFYISGNQNPYAAVLYADKDYYMIDRLANGSDYWIPIQIANQSNRAMSSLLNINLSYHLYRDGENGQELLSLENERTALDNILPGEKAEIFMKFTVPETPGRYILYVDLVCEGVTWYSEHGMLTKPIIIEVV